MKRFLSLIAVLWLLSSVSVLHGETTWNLVTNASNLTVGDQIIIASANKDFALSTTQNANNRGQADIVKSESQCTLSPEVQVITLQSGTLPNTLALFVGDGYLYAASSSSNYLRTQAENDANGSFVIEIGENGVATVKAQGENTNNNLRYYSNSGLFSCYANTEGNVCIYKAFSSSSCTITYSENGTTSQVQCAVGETVTLKTPEEINGFVAQGWTINPMQSPSNTPPSLVTNPFLITEGVTLYAVYAIEESGGFEKISSPLDDYSGTYLIVNEENNAAFNGGLEELDVASNYVDVEISENMILPNGETNAAVFTISKTTEGYSIRSLSGYYIGRTANSSGLNASQTTVYDNTIDIDGEGNAVVTASNAMVLRFNSSANQKRFRYYAGTQKAIQLYRRGEHATRCYCTSIDIISSPLTITTNTEWINPTSLANTVIVKDNALLVGTMIGNKNADLLILDGGQIECNGGVFATFKKEIDASSEWGTEYLATDGWYGISSPIVGNVDATDVTGLLTSGSNDYDFYMYSEPESEWLNYKDNENNFASLLSGEGYLYASKEGTTLQFAGELNTDDVISDISYLSENELLKGFNLLGNPFPKSITLTNVEGADFSGFCLATDAGAWEVHVGNADEIKPGEAFLVQTDEPKRILIKKNAESTRDNKANQKLISVKVENDKYTDYAHAILESSSEKLEMSKFPHQNNAIHSLSIYNKAIAVIGEDTDEFVVSLSVPATGIFKIYLDVDEMTKNEISYLHIIDLQNGNDIDMLVENSYEFVGSPADDKDRFIVKLKKDSNVVENEDDTDVFVYQNGRNLIVNGRGIIQVVDMSGRIVLAKNIDNENVSVESLNSGVYIVKLAGDRLRTQKIVVE